MDGKLGLHAQLLCPLLGCSRHDGTGPQGGVNLARGEKGSYSCFEPAHGVLSGTVLLRHVPFCRCCADSTLVKPSSSPFVEELTTAVCVEAKHGKV